MNLLEEEPVEAGKCNSIPQDNIKNIGINDQRDTLSTDLPDFIQ